MKHALTTVFIFLCTFCFVASASALEISKTEDMDHHKMWHKFKRGVINVVTAPVEIPKNMKAEYKTADEGKTGSKVVSTVGGAVKGMAYMGGRLGSGLWDMITFAQAVPKDYKPLMTPEYVCEDCSKKKK